METDGSELRGHVSMLDSVEEPCCPDNGRGHLSRPATSRRYTSNIVVSFVAPGTPLKGALSTTPADGDQDQAGRGGAQTDEACHTAHNIDYSNGEHMNVSSESGRQEIDDKPGKRRRVKRTRDPPGHNEEGVGTASPTASHISEVLARHTIPSRIPAFERRRRERVD